MLSERDASSTLVGKKKKKKESLCSLLHHFLALFDMEKKKANRDLRTVLRLKSQKLLSINRNIVTGNFCGTSTFTLSGLWSEIQRCQQQPTTTSDLHKLILFNVFDKLDMGQSQSTAS